MKFQLTLNVDVPDELQHVVPDDPGTKAEFLSLVNAAVSAAIECWAMSKIESGKGIGSTALSLEAMPDGSGFRSMTRDDKIH